MRYSRSDIREALSLARAGGKDCTGMSVDARDTEISLERWGFLPRDGEKIDDKMRDWYVSQGLAVRTDKAPEKVQVPVPQPLISDAKLSATEAAMTAAEAALTAAQAALSLARSLQVPAA